MRCPICDGLLEDSPVDDTPLSRCSSCGSVWIPRTSILSLKDSAIPSHPALLPASAPERRRWDKLRCPRCHREMDGFSYRGGSTMVDRCRSCDAFFLDPGELRSILEEWRRGIETSDTARVAMLMHAFGRKESIKIESIIMAAGLALIFFSALSEISSVLYDFEPRSWLVIPLAVGLALLIVSIAWIIHRKRRDARLSRLDRSIEKVSSKLTAGKDDSRDTGVRV